MQGGFGVVCAAIIDEEKSPLDSRHRLTGLAK
jgi:hypothetical protein